MGKQSPPAARRLCVPTVGLRLGLKGKSQKAPFALQQPFFCRSHRYVLVFHPLLAPSWVRGLQHRNQTCKG